MQVKRTRIFKNIFFSANLRAIQAEMFFWTEAMGNANREKIVDDSLFDELQGRDVLLLAGNSLKKSTQDMLEHCGMTVHCRDIYKDAARAMGKFGNDISLVFIAGGFSEGYWGDRDMFHDATVEFVKMLREQSCFENLPIAVSVNVKDDRAFAGLNIIQVEKPVGLVQLKDMLKAARDCGMCDGGWGKKPARIRSLFPRLRVAALGT
ncbi:MAG: hypothetical protein KGI97_00500 [Alphaproteobacteria bacterium]|nr:hypothetical protein [Alphaproteobacteria bacterium]